MLLKGWKRSTLGECTKLLSGNTPSKERQDYWSGDFPWVTVKDMKTPWLHRTGLNLTKAGKAAASVAPANSILVVTRGMALLKDLPISLAMRDVAFNQDIKAIVPNQGLDARFLAYQLQSKKHAVLDMVDTAGHGTGKLDTDLLKSVDLVLPPISEQRRIAQILATWDQAIATAERQLANSQRCTSDLMASMLSGHRRFPEFSDKWRYVDLDTVFERVTHKNSTQNTNVLTISGEHGLINQRDYFNKSVASANLSGYTLLHRYDFAYNKSYSAGYPMGAIKPLLAYDAGVVSSLYLCFKLRDDVDADFDFFRHYFEAGLLNQEIEGIAQEGARNHGLLNVSVTDFFKLQLHIPTAPEQRRIAEVINVARAEEARLQAQVQALRQEKAAIMSQLLTGKRRVKLPDAETDGQA